MRKVSLLLTLLFAALPAFAQSSPSYGGGFTSTGLTLNGKASINGTRLRLTDGGAGEASSAFFNTPVNVQSFTNDFSFRLTSATADGFTFTIQGNSATALGPSGGGLGYGPSHPGGTPGIGKSVAVKFDLYSNAGEGIDSTGWYINGASPTTPSVDLTSTGIDLHKGDVMNVHMSYDGTTLTWTITDPTAGTSFTTSAAVNIPSLVGGTTAYVGFTGGAGGLTAIQDILTWTYGVATPTFNPAGGTYTASQLVAISDTTTGALIYYTNDGSTPTTSSTQYSGPIAVSSTTTIKAIAAASGMTNSAVATATYTIQSSGGGSSPSYGSGFTSAGLALNGHAAISGTRLRLTDGGTGESSSAFFNTPVNVQSFTNDFSFQLANATADGFTFTIQGNSPTALGVGGGGLGYGSNNSGNPGIGKSVAVKFDLYSNAGEGIDSTGSYTNGVSPTIPSQDMTSSGVDLHSGDVMNVHMSYDGTALSWTITDATAGKTFNSLATFINIPSVVGGGTAFVGFTGGAGGLSAIQDIMSWTYAAVAAMPTFDPPASLYGTAQSVTISDTTSGALIFYTTDGSKPTTSSTQYSGPIAAGSTTTINAIAVASGWSNSAVSTATFTIRNGGAGGTFTWPVDAPVAVAQFGISGAPSNDYSAYNGANPQNSQFHTGIDVCPMAAGCQRGEPVYAAGDGVVQVVVVTSDPVQTLCDGSSSSSLPNNGNSNLGNAVIIAHANGKFTVYGHLDCIWPGISAGVAVSQGVRIGSIGNSAFGLRRHFFTPHTHFEMKDSGVLGDPTSKGYSGYTPDLPDGYGYHDARIYLFPFSATNISATAVKVVASPSLDVRSGPGTTYAFLTKATTGQEFVAFATSGSWYQIFLPNSNGPVSGWIEGGQTLAVPDPAATQIQVFGTGSAGLLIRPSPGATTNFVSWDGTFFNCAPGAKIWDGQRFVTSANQSGWFQYYLPASHYFDSSNACGVPMNPGPSLGWSSGSFLH